MASANIGIRTAGGTVNLDGTIPDDVAQAFITQIADLLIAGATPGTTPAAATSGEVTK